MNIADSLSSLPILFLAVSCNFTGNLLSCENQELFTNNMYVKHFVLYMILLITVVYTNKKNFITGKLEKQSFSVQLLSLLGYSAFIYLLFVLLTKMRFIYIVVALVILFVHVFVTDYKKNQVNPENKEEIEKYETVELVLEILLGFITVVGVGLYYMKQKSDHGNEFSISKFLVGVPVCKRMK